jgi:propionyl-CoA carboxylase beta chain
MSSGVIPQISAIMGPCAGGAVYSPAMTDFIIMVTNTSNMFITGPDVVKTVTHEEVTPEALGGALTHASKSGVAVLAAASEEEAIQYIRNLLSFVPQNNLEDPPFVPTEDDPQRMDPRLRDLVPDDPTKSYDIKEVIGMVVDDGNFLEVHALWAKNIVCGFARFGGRSVGIVANQPAFLAGVLDIDSSKKAGPPASYDSAMRSTFRS